MVSVDQIDKNLSSSSLVTVWERGELWTHKYSCHRHPWCTLVLWLDLTKFTKSEGKTCYCWTIMEGEESRPRCSAVLYLRLAAEQRGIRHLADPLSKIRIWPQPAVAGVGTSKSGVGTNKAIHAIMSYGLTQVLQLLLTSLCPWRPHHQFSDCSYFLIHIFSSNILIYFGSILLTFFYWFFFILGRLA